MDLRNKKFLPEDPMNLWQLFLLIAVLSLPFLVWKCQGDPDEACAAICRIHGFKPGIRISHGWEQDCSLCGNALRREKVRINRP